MSLKETPIDADGFVDVNDIGIEDDALLCLTNDTNCCTGDQTGGAPVGIWRFPNGMGVPTLSSLGRGTGFGRDRGQSVVRLHRQNNPSERGRFRCELLGDTIYVNVCESLKFIAMQLSSSEIRYIL